MVYATQLRVVRVVQLVMYTADGSFRTPVAHPFDNSVLGLKFQFWLENLFMPLRLVSPLLRCHAGCMSCSC